MDTEKTFEISFENQRLKFGLLGSQILSWEVLDQKSNRVEDILYRGKSINRTGIPILFPFANPLQNNLFLAFKTSMPQHGFGRISRWNLENLTDSTAVTSLSSLDLEPRWKIAYPFQFKIELHLKLKVNNIFTHQIKITNLSGIKMPIAPGIHPYFSCLHNFKKDLNITDIDPLSFKKIDWDKSSKGAFFDFLGKTRVKLERYELQITETSKSKDFRYLVLWSQTRDNPDFDFICIEPFSRETDALNQNPILLAPHEIWDKSFDFQVMFGNV
jgi:galactose mutarotase-like enzyme